ncbi:MAG: nucleotidyl transferase AbiEii/AbiGii toxin family protein [Deltaproteobacteria bacterium]|nr:nucleotidyl transferase AbiEii/AbiGii toxin family protein [Deltaproteobacteria bacterium]
MRDAALALVAGIDDPSRRLNLLREYVQAFALRSLHESEAFAAVAFVGGTALRFLENIPRFSENLDLSVIDEGRYAPERWLGKLRRDLELAGFDCGVTLNRRRTVHVGWLRVAGLLAAAGLAQREEHKLAVKIEIDTRPPAGADVVRTVVHRHLTFALAHYAPSSLMAGKVHALITRPYPKGRDWYDLLWFLAHRPPLSPKLDLLQNALDQTRGEGRLDAARWRDHLLDKLEDLDVAALARELRVFLERPADSDLLTRENLRAVLLGSRKENGERNPGQRGLLD